MPYSLCVSAREVDKATAKRISNVTGGHDEEMKLHRKAIKALSVLSFSNDKTQLEITEAQKDAAVVEAIDKQIEAIIAEGKRFKVNNGWM